jgi:uncharacterized protein YjbI with pentapeptide repeats
MEHEFDHQLKVFQVLLYPTALIMGFVVPYPIKVSIHDWLFNLPVDNTSRRRASFFSSTLVLPALNVYEGLKIDDPEKVKWRDYVFLARGRDLKGANLAFAGLQKVDFEGAELQGARLYMAQLQHASLQTANLQAASLSFAQLQGAKLDGARLRCALIRDTEVRCASLLNAKLQNASLDGVQLQGASMSGAEFQDASLRGAQLQGASLEHSQLQGARLDGAQLQGAALVDVQLQGASLKDRDDYREADLRNAMGRLFKGRKIKNAAYGRKGDERKKITREESE